MTRTVTRLFDDYKDALAAVRDLEQADYDPNMISLVANNAEGRHGEAKSFSPVEREARGTEGRHSDAADDAVKGAGAGALLGGGAGLLAGIGVLAIPGIGPAVAAGWLATTALGAVAGAAVGGAAGGLIGALTHAGHSEEEAHVYAEGVRRGGALVSIRVADDAAPTVEDIMKRHGGVDAAERGRAYREAGWSGRFDEQAQPYSREQIERERGMFGRGA